MTIVQIREDRSLSAKRASRGEEADGRHCADLRAEIEAVAVSLSSYGADEIAEGSI
jgi:hypothetical protein